MIERVKQLDINQFDYPLPDERIARHPLPKRDSAKLLLYQNAVAKDYVYTDLPKLLPNQSKLVFNQTRVVQARLFFSKNEHTTIEIFCLEPWDDVPLQWAMEQTHSIQYRCMVGGAKKWKEGPLQIQEDGITLIAEKKIADKGVFCIQFSWTNNLTFAEILEHIGKTPLPPYMKRAAEEKDKTSYQTVFAKQDGSVAAPTAGLHFTGDLLKTLKQNGVEQHFLTLHVGAGTFKPVSAKELQNHIMHAEEFFIEQEFLEQCLLMNEQKQLICVGTTSLRALESMYWLGFLLTKNPQLNGDELFVPQWIAYEHEKEAITMEEAINGLLSYMKNLGQNFLRARTQIIIAPGYKFRLAKGLLTNFHQPKSTLLLLIAAILGDTWKEMYQHALDHNYRFLSYGDGSFLPIAQ